MPIRPDQQRDRPWKSSMYTVNGFIPEVVGGGSHNIRIVLLVLLLVIVRCVAACCFHCCVKRPVKLSSRKIVTVVTVSGSDSVYASDVPDADTDSKCDDVITRHPLSGDVRVLGAAVKPGGEDP
ncbi:unnamed protein product [Ranitomeya imitator]|uniref:Uncharacterized protein n=1 Tax=Ranitomeya imitator TaxID=111125 RepID=A0ABN9LPE4_9NEOB|nr:unnamed protein product [Ranitomeya imitator]